MRTLLASIVALLVAASASAAPNLIVISLDTTRADALSCYGSLPGLPADVQHTTPNIDRLAAGGLRFERFYAHAPTTLSSHASMMTGRDPHQHAIVRNGFPVPPALPTLAERMKGAGYDTIAVVAAAALEQDMGLDRGFRVYDDDAPELHGVMHQDRADGVYRRTVRHLAERGTEAPLFLFVHFYDPHAPYDAPGLFRERYTDPDYDGPYRQIGPGSFQVLREALARGKADPADIAYIAGRYAGEVSFVDAWVGRLVSSLERQGLLDEAVLVVTADHGEALSEQPMFSYTHGTDVSEGVMHVPLIIRGYGVPMGQPGTVRSQAEMSGLPPTLERAVGLDPTLGRDFWDLVRPGPVRDEDGWPERPTRTVFMEATRPHQDDTSGRWNNLDLFRGVLAGGFALRSAPVFRIQPTLEDAYALGPTAEGRISRLLQRMLAAWDAAAPGYRGEDMGDETREALEALGYVE